jgi:hypothetical protein
MVRMASERVITAAVDRAVETATVDPDEGCRFDPDALAGVIRFCDSGKNADVVTAVVDRALQRWIEGLDTQRTLAAVTLRTRIAAATARRQVVVENIQGDVGTGTGGQS